MRAILFGLATVTRSCAAGGIGAAIPLYFLASPGMAITVGIISLAVYITAIVLQAMTEAR